LHAAESQDIIFKNKRHILSGTLPLLFCIFFVSIQPNSSTEQYENGHILLAHLYKQSTHTKAREDGSSSMGLKEPSHTTT
jgi:hypothetical protein